MKIKKILLMVIAAMTLASCGKTGDAIIDEKYQIYLMAKENGFVGTYQEWLDSIKGKDGTDGKDGVDGKDGQDGHTPVITIGENGNWFIDGVDTGVKARGENGQDGKDGVDGQNGKDGTNGVDGKDGQDGHTPVITIGENGNWFIDGVDTGVKARGENGQNGSLWLTGTVNPNNSEGNNGDCYLNTETCDVFVKSNGGWILIGNIKGERGDSATLKGDPGASVQLAFINSEGNLIIVLTDGTRIDAGNVTTIVQNPRMFTVRFYVDGVLVDTQVVEQYTKLSKPDVVKDGYTINGWLLDGEPWVFCGYGVLDNMDLHADLIPNHYTVSFVDPVLGNTFDCMNVVFGETYSLPVIESNIDNVEFDGWTYNSAIVEKQGRWNIANDVVLQARFVNVNQKEINLCSFGQYPQTVVRDSKLIKELDKIEQENEKGYIEYAGKEYKRSIANSQTWYSNGSMYQQTNIFTSCLSDVRNTEIYYFEVEPLKWTIVETTEKHIRLASQFIIDANNYCDTSSNRYINGVEVEATNYAYSSLRKKCLGIYNNAFSKKEKTKLICSFDEFIGINDYVSVQSSLYYFNYPAIPTDYAVSNGVPRYSEVKKDTSKDTKYSQFLSWAIDNGIAYYCAPECLNDTNGNKMGSKYGRWYPHNMKLYGLRVVINVPLDTIFVEE